MTDAKRIYVLDTNVLMHDPTALFRFEEHDVFLPMMVLEELDAAKKGMSEVSRNVRQASRLLNDLLEANGADKVATGLRLVRRSEEHTSELQSLMRNSYAVFCLKKKNMHRQIEEDIT